MSGDTAGLLAELAETSEAFACACEARENSEAERLSARRAELAKELAAAGELSPAERETLAAVLETGRRSVLTLAARRGGLEAKLAEARRQRRLQQDFRPYSETRGRSLDVVS